MNATDTLRISGNMLYDVADICAVREKIYRALLNKDPFYERLQKQKSISDSFTDEILNDLGHQANPWRTFNYTFIAPPAAASLEYALKAGGQGCIWLGNAGLVNSTNGMEISSPKYGRKEGKDWLEGWNQVRLTGNPRFERRTGLTPADQSLIKITNPAATDRGGLEYGEAIPVEAGDVYTAWVNIRLDQPLSEGFYFTIRFKDRQGIYLDNDCQSPFFNRTTQSLWNNFSENIQIDAKLYLFTGDPGYVEKAKKKLLYMLQDIRRGMVECLKSEASGWHPDDCYGAVHVGRAITVLALVYELIKNSGVISQIDDAQIREDLYYITDLLMETYYYDYTDPGWKESNWNTDRCVGLGVFAMVFPDYYRDSTRNSACYLRHARDQIGWQLENVVGADGSWPETIRYHGAVLQSLIIYAKILKRYDGTNLFEHPKLKSMFKFIINIQTPRDTVNLAYPNRIVAPAVADSDYEDVPYKHLGYMALEYLRSDPDLSQEMAWTWERAGSPDFPVLFQELSIDANLKSKPPLLVSSRYEDIGYLIFRQHVGENAEGFCIVNSNASKCIRQDKERENGPGCIWVHNHFDQGSFSIWSDSTPLTLDSGVKGYYNGDMIWFKNSPAHNVVQFRGPDGVWCNGPAISRVEEFHTSPVLDYVRIAIPDKLADRYIRQLALVKGGFDAYVLWDCIDGGTDSRFNLHTLSAATEIRGAKATAHCYQEKDLEATFLLPESITIGKSIGRLSGAYPQDFQEHLKVDAGPGDSYLAILFPKDFTKAGLQVSKLNISGVDAGGAKEVAAFKAQRDNGAWILIVCNSAASGQEVKLTVDAAISDLSDGVKYLPRRGEVALLVAAKSLKILAKA